MHKKEFIATQQIAVPSAGWAHKSSLPSVQFPLHVKKKLIWCFNQKPHMSPDQALTHLKGQERCRNNVFVQCFVTPTRIKSYFGRLKQHRDKNLKASEDVPETFAGAAGTDLSYKDFKSKEDLKSEIKRRNLHVEKLNSLKKSQLVDALVQNDKDCDGKPGEVNPEEDFLMEEAITEDECGGLNDLTDDSGMSKLEAREADPEAGDDSDEEGGIEELTASLLEE
jgi:hypothetical protein